MQLFSGLERTDYQDVLRALGLYLDQEGLKGVRVLEVEGGLLVQGVPIDPDIGQHFQSALLSDEQIRELLRQAYARRQPPQQAAETMQPPLLLPEGEVLFKPGWTALNLSLRNHGVGPASLISTFARWRNLALSGNLSGLESGDQSNMVLERVREGADVMIDERDDSVLRLRVLYRDQVGNHYDLLAEYGHQGGWRVARVPSARARATGPATGMLGAAYIRPEPFRRATDPG